MPEYSFGLRAKLVGHLLKARKILDRRLILEELNELQHVHKWSSNLGPQATRRGHKDKATFWKMSFQRASCFSDR